jgi:recyclin-1
MDKFAILEPTKLNASAATTSARLLYRNHTQKPSTGLAFVGRLPADLHLLVLTHLPVPDIPSYCRCSRRTASLAREDKVWEIKWKSLGVEKHNLADVLDALEKLAQGEAAALRSAPTISSFQSKYIRAHLLLKSTTSALTSPPHLILSALTPFVSSSLIQQAKILHLLSLFLSPLVQPLKAWGSMYASLRSAIDRFEATLLAAFDHADSQGEEDKMREVAESSWEVWDGAGDWELGKVWAEKREVFYEQGHWDPLDNFKYVQPTFSFRFNIFTLNGTCFSVEEAAN